MKTHLPTGLRKALIAAIFAVSAVAYNAQAATEYTEDAELGIIDTTTPGTPSYDRQVSIKNGAEITVSGGVTVNGLLVSEGATLDSASTVRSDNDGGTPGVIGVTTNSKIDVEHGSLISGSSVLVSDHGTVIVQDGGLSTGYHGSYPANGVLGIDDHSKVSVTNGDIDLRADLVVNDRSELTQKDGHLTIEDGDMYITNHSHVTIKNGNLTIGGKTEDIGGGLEDIKSGALVIDGSDNVHDVYLKVTSGKNANGNVQALVVDVNKADLIVGGDLTATVGAVYLDEAETTIGGNVLTNSGLAVSEGTLKAGDVTVTNEWLLKQAGKIIEDASGYGHDTQVAMLNGASAMMADRILGVELEDVSEATLGHVDSAGSIIVTESTLKAESLVANDTVAEAIYNKISDTISEEVADEVKLPTSNIVLVGSDVTVAGEVKAADSILVEGEVTLPDDTKVVKGFLNAGGDVTAGGALKVHKADLTAANVNADCGVFIEGDEENLNTLQTGNITVANLAAQNDTMTNIQDIADNISLMPDAKIDAAVGAVSQMAMDLKGVSITNVAEGSTVGEVASVGNITIKGSTLTAGSLTADVSELSQAVKDKVQTSIGNDAADAVSTYLPLAHISVSESDVTVLGEVYSETEIDVKDGSLLAEGNVTAADGNITATNADIASADMTVEHGFVKVEGGSLLATGAVIADAGLTATGDTEKGSMIKAGSITVENTMATNATLNNLQMIKADPSIEQEDKAWHVNSEIGALSDQLKGVSIADMAEGSAVGDVVSVGDITITGSTLKAGSLKADDSGLSKTVNDKVVQLFGAEVAKEVADGLPLAKITVTDSVVEVTGDVFSETTLEVTKSDFASGNVSADAGVTIKGEDKIVEGSDKQDNRNTIAMGDITVENKAAIADAVDTIAEAKALIGTDFADAEEALAALAARKNELQQSLGDVSIENVRKSSVGAVSTNGDITIKGSNMTADSLTADATDVREALTGAITAQFGAEAAEKLADSLPTVSITVEDSKVKVKGEVTSDTEIKVTNGGLLAKGDVTANDGNITAMNADLASADMTAEHGRIDVLGGSLDATGDVKADGGLTVVGNAEGTSSLNAASITVENKDLVVTLQDRLKEILDDSTIPGPDKRDIAEVAINEVSHMVNGVTVKGVTSGTVGDVASVGRITITGSELTTGSLTTDASDLREGFSTVTEELFDVLSGHAAQSVPAPTITVQGSTLTVEGDMTSESTIKTTDSIVKVAGDVKALANGITISGGKLIAEGTVSAPQEVSVYGATLQAQTIEAKRLRVNDGSKVKVEDTITADIHGNGGTITSTGTEGNGLTIVGNVKSEGVTIKAPEGDLTVTKDITGDSNKLTVVGDGNIDVQGTISGNSNTLNTKGEGDIHVNKIDGTEGTTMTAANGDITIDTLSGYGKQMTVTSKKGGVKVTNDSVATLKESAITAKEDITIGDAAVNNGMDMLALTGGTTVTSTKGDITLNQNVQVSDENTAITAAKGTVTFASYANMLQDGATVTADTIELAEGAKLRLGENSADALQGKLSGKGMIIASWDDLNRDFDDTAFNGNIMMSGGKKLTISDKGVGADANITLNSTGTTLDVTSTGASLGNVAAGATGSVVTINAGTIDTETTASSLTMGEATLNIDASADSADLITVTKYLQLGQDHTVRVNAQESLESVKGDVRHTIIRLAEGAVNEGVSEEAQYDLVDGQRKLQGKNINLVNAGDHVDLVISTNFRGTEQAKPNQEAVNTTLKALSAEVSHEPGVLAEMPSDLAHVLDALDNTRSEAATLSALQSLSAAGNLVVPNMMMDTTRNHLSTLRNHMAAPTCYSTENAGISMGGNVWGAYTGGHDRISGDKYTGRYSHSYQGAIVGTDYSLNCKATAGIALGYENARSRMDSTKADSDAIFADLYTTLQTGRLTHRFSAGVAVYDIDMTRHANVSAAAHSYSGTSKTTMDAMSWNLGYELSSDIKLGKASMLTPFAAVDVAFHSLDTLREKGQGDASVITKYDDPVQVDVAAGATFTQAFRSFTAESSQLHLSAAVHGELSETRPSARNQFVGGGDDWKVRSAKRTPIYGEIGASVNVPVYRNWSVGAGAAYEFGGDRQSVSGNVGVNCKF